MFLIEKTVGVVRIFGLFTFVVKLLERLVGLGFTAKLAERFFRRALLPLRMGLTVGISVRVLVSAVRVVIATVRTVPITVVILLLLTDIRLPSCAHICVVIDRLFVT